MDNAIGLLTVMLGVTLNIWFLEHIMEYGPGEILGTLIFEIVLYILLSELT